MERPHGPRPGHPRRRRRPRRGLRSAGRRRRARRLIGRRRRDRAPADVWIGVVEGRVVIRALREVGCSLGSTGVLVLCYHVVRSAARFASYLDVLTARGYTIVPLMRALAWLGGGEPLPAPTALLTFDDLDAGQLEHAVPVLAERGMPATFFP